MAKVTDPKKLSLVVDLTGIDLGDKAKDTAVERIVANVIENIMHTYSQLKRGLTEPERKQFYRVQNALEKAVKEEAKEVELANEDFGFIRKCKREALLTPNELLQRVEELIDACAV